MGVTDPAKTRIPFFHSKERVRNTTSPVTIETDRSQLGIRSLMFLKKVVNFGRNFLNFDKVLIINLGLACSNNGDQDDHMAFNS
jgi:hypothetical protein